MKFEYCALDEEDMTVCWAVNGGRIFIHFTSSLSELIALRRLIDIMIGELEGEKVKKDEEHKVSLRAERVRKSK